MSEFPASQSLLERIARRLYVARLGTTAYRTLIVIALVYVALLLISRLTGLIPDWFAPPTVGLLPIVAALVAIVWMRRPSAADAARRVDEHAGTKDLYLTLTMLEGAAGAYQPLVGRDAESRAADVAPQVVIPWHWGWPTLKAAACLLLLAIASFFVPSLDPFGKVAQAKEQEIRREELQKSSKTTEIRKSQLAGRDIESAMSDDIKKSLQDLQSDLKRTQPAKQKDNARVLAAHQKSLGEKWRFNAEQLKQLLNQRPLDQRFGAAQPSQARQWLKQLQEGNPDALQQELDQVREDLKAAMNQGDPVKRTEAMRRLQKKLDEMRDFARDEVNSKPLTAALERAMKQLDAMKSGELSKEASEAAEESMRLASLELKQLSQSMRDLKQLEKALETLQMAKKLNTNEQLDGQACEDCQSMADYAELYAEMMAELGYDVAMGEGENPGNGEGRGAAEIEAEDESVKTDFKEEEAKSTIQKGKILLSLKTKGVSVEDGEELELQYQAVVKGLQQSVSEAIDQEQIPPGYHEGIKKYFDSLDETQAE